MLEVISTLGAGFVKNLDDAFGVLPDCQPSRGFSISTFDVTSLGTLHALQKNLFPYLFIYLFISVILTERTLPLGREKLHVNDGLVWIFQERKHGSTSIK